MPSSVRRITLGLFYKGHRDIETYPVPYIFRNSDIPLSVPYVPLLFLSARHIQ